MSLEQGILHGKEKRKQYSNKDARSHVRSCRGRGKCQYCNNNRLHKHKRHEPIDQLDYDTYMLLRMVSYG